MKPYDSRTPVRPAFEGRYLQPDHREFVAGRDYVAQAAAELLRTGLPLAADIETTGIGPEAFSIKVVTIGTKNLVIALDPRDPAQRHLVRYVFDNATELVFHNAPFDIPPLVHWGMLALDDVSKVIDTMVLYRLAEPDTLVKKNLTAATTRYLGIEADTATSITASFKAAGFKKMEDGWKYMDIDSPVYLRGAMMDTAVTAQLLEPLMGACYSRLMDHPFGVYGLSTKDEVVQLIVRETLVNRVMMRRSALGIPVDLDVLNSYQEAEAQKKLELGSFLAGHDIEHTKAATLIKALEAVGGLPSDHPKTPKGAASTAAKHLEAMSHPLAQAYVDLKRIDKVEAYMEKIQTMATITGRIHPQVGVLGASATGRMAYSEPPLQQFSEGARPILTAEEGKELTSVDWSSIEPVVMAVMAKDKPLLEAYNGGGDLYAPIVAQTGLARKTAKVVLLGIMYGIGAKALGKDMGVSEETAKGHMNAIRSSIPASRAFMHQTKTIGENHRMALTISGRVLPVPRIKDPTSGQWKTAGYKATNYTCQGSAYDILAETIRRLHAKGLSDHIVLAMHDELVVETDVAAEVRAEMEWIPERLQFWSEENQRLVLRTDRADMGRHWLKV